MEPEIYFIEQWLRQRDADLRADSWARRTRSSEAKETSMRGPTDTHLVEKWKDIARSFLKLGATSYGGPAMMGIMQAELQQKRQWVSKERFVEGLSVANMMPGATVVQLGIFLGYARGGWWGGLLAGLCFVLPAFFVMLLLTVAYAGLGVTPIARGALYGLGPVAVGLFAVALYRLGRSAASTKSELSIAVIAAIASAATPLGIVAILMLAGAAGLLLFHPRTPLIMASSLITCATVLGVSWWLTTAAPTVGFGAVPNPQNLAELGAFFLKVGAFTIGGGLTMIAFIQEQVVGQFHWLTPREFVDGLAMSQLTPGPLLMIAAYVGYKVAGLAGAAIAATGAFLPSFVVMLAILPVLDRVRKLAWVRAAMRGMAPAVIGVLVVSLVPLAPAALPDLFAIAILAATIALQIALGIGAFKLLAAGAVLGLLRSRTV
jgi:chromate transporter